MRNLTDEELQALKTCIHEPMKNFLDETVGSEMGRCMYPHLYEEPASQKPDPGPGVNWQASVQGSDGKDTGMRIQVWNGDGSVAEVEHCTDIAMMLNELYERKKLAGETVTSKDIGDCIRAGCVQNIKSPITATRIAEMSRLLDRVLAKSSDGPDTSEADIARYLEYQKACQCTEELKTAATKERFCQLLKDNYDLIPAKFYDLLWETLHPNLNETEQ